MRSNKGGVGGMAVASDSDAGSVMPRRGESKCATGFRFPPGRVEWAHGIGP